MGKRPPSAFQRAIANVQRQAAHGSSVGPRALIANRYELQRELGKGAYGVVYEALDRTDGERVAVKILHDHAMDEETRLRMMREAHALRRLDGTCAVAIRDFAEMEGGRLYLVMEYLDGENLEDFAEASERRGTFLSLRDVGVLLRPIVDTLDVAHAGGMIHRDLKPENIFVLRAGGDRGTRLLDFGLVKDLGLAKMTAVGSVAGSPLYIAPEAWSGRPDQLDHRVDVYSLGVIVFRLLTGRTPFHDCEDVLSLMTAATSGPRPSALRHRAGLHPSIDAWTERALAIRPEERFGSVRELWDRLGHVVAYSIDQPTIPEHLASTAGPTRPAKASEPPSGVAETAYWDDER